MDSSILLKDQIWFLRVCHHILFSLYNLLSVFICVSLYLTLFVNYSLIFVFVVNTTGLILLVLNIIMYLTRSHLVWFRTFITLLLVLLLTCSISHFIVIVDSWNANKIQIQFLKMKVREFQYPWNSSTENLCCMLSLQSLKILKTVWSSDLIGKKKESKQLKILNMIICKLVINKTKYLSQCSFEWCSYSSLKIVRVTE